MQKQATRSNPRTQIRVTEIFGPVLQGEGAQAGQPTIFVRTFGCDYDCWFCDSKFSWMQEHKDETTPMTPHEMLNRVKELSGGRPLLITISGGNPAIYGDPMEEFILAAQSAGYEVTIETQGSVPQAWMAQLDHMTVSPKLIPTQRTDWEKLDQVIALGKNFVNTSLKVVVFDDEGFDFAKTVHGRYPHIPFYMSVGNLEGGNDGAEPRDALLDKLEWLSEKAMADGLFDVKILPQLHVLMFGAERAK